MDVVVRKIAGCVDVQRNALSPFFRPTRRDCVVADDMVAGDSYGTAAFWREGIAALNARRRSGATYFFPRKQIFPRLFTAHFYVSPLSPRHAFTPHP